MTTEEKAYIAGFLDGDGCIMLQLIYRHDYILGYQIRASVVFYQNKRFRYFLEWIKKKLRDGYIRERNDGIVEYTIVGVRPVMRVLRIFQPYVRLKKNQVDVSINVLKQMPGTGRNMQPQLLLQLAKEVDKFIDMNYSKKRKNTSKQVEQFFQSRNLLIP